MGDSRPELPPLGDRYLRTRGRVHLTGLQALVRLPLDQLRRDRAAGRRVAALISGYPGSPLAGFDQELMRVERLLLAEDVRFLPGLNEELAAGAVGGTQLLDLFPHSRIDGVVGMWYGKAPGLDRSLDVLRHACFVGTSRLGGALAVVGDDPSCKSSSLTSHSEHAFAHALIPVLVPADAGDVLELGLHGFALSRYSGLWVGLKIVADVADGGAILTLNETSRSIELPKFEVRGRTFAKRLDTRLLPPHVNRIEEEIIYERLEAVRRYAFENGLNPIRHRHAHDRIGIIASGRLYRELETALDLLGLDVAALEQHGLRLLKMELLYPIEPRRLASFADGLDEILVIDHRRGYLEDAIRAALFNAVDRPMVLGQYDETGAPWIARHVDILAETIAVDLADHLTRRLGLGHLVQRAAPLRKIIEPPQIPAAPVRTPVFCSGCPHSTSTRLPEGSQAGGGIGCHTMALLMDRRVPFVGAMGAEGSAWTGLAPFVDTPHLFQNLGDGTYFHSGRQAVRACVEAGTTVTFKLLYNGTIAMTGGQTAVGSKPLADVVRDLLSDGVRKVVAMSRDPALRALARRDRRVSCISREAYDEAMERLRTEPGVTALIYDAICANQKQRLERRGLRPTPERQIVINEDICEGCGDCGVRSTCISLRPVQTALGRKTRIHVNSCSDDRACLDGDCPAFMSVPATPPVPLPEERWRRDDVPEPVVASMERERFEIFLVGVGSTGVVSLDATLLRAAELDGLHALHLDQTGLAQRGGKVVSHCILSRRPVAGSPRVSLGRADLLLALDPMSACQGTSPLALAADRTHAIVHEVFAPTGAMVTDPELEPPALGIYIDEIRARTRSLFALPAEELAEVVLGEPLSTNMVLLGAALQRGLLPLSLASVEQAIRERGVAVERNLAALDLGRVSAAHPDRFAQLLEDARPSAVGEEGDPDAAARILGKSWHALADTLRRFDDSDDRVWLRQRVADLALDLVDYQSRGYARRYLAALREIARAECAADRRSCELTATAARELYRLMAYKDEYEVARLHLRGPFRRWMERRQKTRLAPVYHLHPPLLRALGLRRKLALGRAIEPMLRGLVALRWLRGTPLDPFGRSAVRSLERELPAWYEAVLCRIAGRLGRENLTRAIEIAAAPRRIRGYEQLKLERARRVREEVDQALASLPHSG